jgi:hypothetical protein
LQKSQVVAVCGCRQTKDYLFTSVGSQGTFFLSKTSKTFLLFAYEGSKLLLEILKWRNFI